MILDIISLRIGHFLTLDSFFFGSNATPRKMAKASPPTNTIIKSKTSSICVVPFCCTSSTFPFGFPMCPDWLCVVVPIMVRRLRLFLLPAYCGHTLWAVYETLMPNWPDRWQNQLKQNLRIDYCLPSSSNLSASIRCFAIFRTCSSLSF